MKLQLAQKNPGDETFGKSRRKCLCDSEIQEKGIITTVTHTEDAVKVKLRV